MRELMGLASVFGDINDCFNDETGNLTRISNVPIFTVAIG